MGRHRSLRPEDADRTKAIANFFISNADQPDRQPRTLSMLRGIDTLAAAAGGSRQRTGKRKRRCDARNPAADDYTASESSSGSSSDSEADGDGERPNKKAKPCRRFHRRWLLNMPGMT